MENVKTFNLRLKRPQVVLIGNGLIFQKENCWKNIIKKIGNLDNGFDFSNEVPYSIQATVTTATKDSKRCESYQKVFTDEEKYHYCRYESLEKLVNLPFDAILTTNYTYEIENVFKPNFSSFNTNKQRKFAFSSSDRYKDTKYFIRTFNRLGNENINDLKDIWHIHGEIRRPSSMVLTHDEYARLIGKILEYNIKQKNKYQLDFESLTFYSWIDYFIMGDLYIIGQGFDFSEFDLWWLLSRRQRERGEVGKVIFYNPIKESDEAKIDALSQMGVKCKSFDICVDDNDGAYSEFYEKAIDDIQEELSKANIEELSLV